GGEAEVARGAALARVRRVGHELLDVGEVRIEDHRAVELDLDLRALDGDLLEVPLAHRPEVAALRGDHAIGRAVRLARVDPPLIPPVAVVEDLELAHAQVGGVAVARISDRQAVVAARRQLELDPRGEVLELLVVVDDAPLVRLALQDAGDDLVVLDRPGPVGEVPAVEGRAEALGAVLGQDLVGLVGRDLADGDVPPLDLVVVRLELDRAAGDQRELTITIPEVLPPRVVDDQLVIEVDGRPLADLDDPEGVPLADRLVGDDQRVLAGRAGAVIPERARALALVGPQGAAARLGEVPDLDLRVAAEVDAAVPLRADLEIDLQLDVAVVLVGGEVGAQAV